MKQLKEDYRQSRKEALTAWSLKKKEQEESGKKNDPHMSCQDEAAEMHEKQHKAMRRTLREKNALPRRHLQQCKGQGRGKGSHGRRADRAAAHE